MPRFASPSGSTLTPPCRGASIGQMAHLFNRGKRTRVSNHLLPSCPPYLSSVGPVRIERSSPSRSGPLLAEGGGGAGALRERARDQAISGALSHADEPNRSHASSSMSIVRTSSLSSSLRLALVDGEPKRSRRAARSGPTARISPAGVAFASTSAASSRGSRPPSSTSPRWRSTTRAPRR